MRMRNAVGGLREKIMYKIVSYENGKKTREEQ